jgi:uncharacterized oxidoreductase
MRITKNVILITGGATGIGLALAEIFLQKENEVIICSRRKNKLDDAKYKLSQLYTFQCDVAIEEDRNKLTEWVTSEFGNLNILVNNAGIQNEIDFRKGIADLQNNESEIDINFKAPVRLSAVMIPHLMKQKDAAIINISSGLGFAPISIMPVYCATKAALHSYSLSLRHQLRKTSIKVFEIIPPTVDTELDRGARDRRGQTDRGIKPDIVALAAIEAIENDKYEIAVGQAQYLVDSSGKDSEILFERMNARFY